MMLYVCWDEGEITYYHLLLGDIPDGMMDDMEYIFMVEWGPDE